jgi:glycine dehydrogenase subunit 1
VPDYLPHTPDEVAEMLDLLGLSSLDDLFAHVPAALRLAGGLDLPDGRPEPDVAVQFAQYTSANVARLDRMICFAGAGAYDHEVPPVVTALASRSEFVTAYTPYQPEVAQGVLQAIFEYQTMISRLAGLPIANASLYDGATALVEAVNMAAGSTRRARILVSAGVHPHWRAVVRTFARGTGHEIVEVPLVDGATEWSSVEAADAAAVVVAYPNYLGVIEDVDTPRALASSSGALLVGCVDPIAAGVLRSAGEWGADIVVGEGQPLGTALAFGGPYLGLFACSDALVRRLPGRLVGETVDVEGRRAFVTTLRAREQDIRREKATSNVCTNQTLMAVTAAIQLGWLGTKGLREVATRSALGAHYAFDQLVTIDGVEPISTKPFLREFAVRTSTSADRVLERLADQGFLGGVAARSLTGGPDGSLRDDEIDNTVVVAVTERRTRSEIDQYAAAFAKAVN